jgi:hypothetical protein
MVERMMVISNGESWELGAWPESGPNSITTDIAMQEFPPTSFIVMLTEIITDIMH